MSKQTWQNDGSAVSDVIEMVGRTEKWVVTLIDGLDKHVDEETRSRILEQCGRQCQSQSFIRKARAIYKKSHDVPDFLEKLGRVYKHLHLEGDRVYVVYPRCYCSRVNKIHKGKVSATYCKCSLGWSKALFEGALERPVEVKMEKSIINGDRECKFRIIL